VDAIVQAAIKSNDPGGSIVVIRDGKVIHIAGYGLADLDSKKPNLPGTRYHMASSGKQFTALSLMMLHQDGRLDYDDPVGKHLPEVARFGDSLTIRQVLHHTSGIPDYYDDSTGYKLLLASSPMPTNDDALALLHRWGTPKPAGREFVYSNSRLRPARHAGRACLRTTARRLSSDSGVWPYRNDRLFLAAQRHPVSPNRSAPEATTSRERNSPPTIRTRWTIW
jgi:hypothetical protein